jgi:class 3 adenylate cyclase/tetratricopeptide (TPR) repeat protein
VEPWPDAAVFVPRLLLARPADAPRWWQADGTMVLVDISGFTSLSDQLAQRGRVGIEDLVATLNRIFTLLLSATDDGGDVVKFAGDALLIFYDGPDHELRACHAAYGMQRLLSVVGAVELAGVRTRLRMSVGVQSGRFEFLLTGRQHRNLIITGPTLTQVMHLQDAARAGEILIGPAAAATLPASWLGGERDGGVVLRRMRPVPSSGSGWHRRVPEPDTVASYLPAAVTSRPDLLGANSEHRRAAVGFVQVEGLDRQLDPALLTRIDALTGVVEDACTETDTTLLYTDVAKDGFRYLLTAGAPRGVEDPEGRLLRALLRISAFDRGLAVRAGAASGHVFAGAVGAPFRRTYTVMGDTINLAARLTARAPSGGVLAHAPLLDRSLTRFATERHDPVTVKGKPEPIPVAVVTGVVAQRGRQLAEVPFVGRQAELAVLTDALEKARGGRGAVVEIVGEGGLGKSRLAGEALSHGGLPVLTLATDPYGAQVPYRGLRLLLRPLLSIDPADEADAAGVKLTAVVSERAPKLLQLLPLLALAVGAQVAPTQAVDELDERFRTARFHDAVRDLLRALLTDPTAILIDDAQWIDETSAGALATAFAEPPWAVILTRRDTGGGLRGNQTMRTIEVRPAPMDSESARHLVSERTRRALRSAEVQAIVGRGGGSPYFLLELAAAAETDGELPETVEELVGARIDNLETSERDTLRHAAVLGSRFHSDLCVAATGDGGLLDVLASPALTSFVTADRYGIVTFTHEIYREVAYGQLTFRARRHLHRLAAQAIERSPDLAGDARLPMLSLHYYNAGVWDRAFDYSAQAARDARGRFATEEAAAFCRSAIDAGRRAGAQPADLRDLYMELGDSCRILGRLVDAHKAYRLARRHIVDPGQLAAVLQKMAFVQSEQGRFAAARRGIAELKRIARTLPAVLQPEIIAEAELAAASVNINEGRFADALNRVTRVIDKAESLKNQPAGKALIARAYAMYDGAAVQLEGPSATRYGSQAIDIFREIGDLRNEARLGANLAVTLYYAGSWDEAVTLNERSAEVAHRIGDVVQVAGLAINLAEILGYQGRLAEAREYLSDAIKTLRAHNIRHALAWAFCFLGVVARLEANYAESGLLLDSALNTMTDAGVRDGFVVDEVIVRRLELMGDEQAHADVIAQALALLARSPEPMSLLHQARVHRSTGRAFRATGDGPAADRHLQESLRIARDLSMPYEVALTLLAVSATDDDDSARREAARIFSSLGVRPHSPM